MQKKEGRSNFRGRAYEDVSGEPWGGLNIEIKSRHNQ